MSRRLSQSQLMELKEAYSVFDQDGDGAITMNELEYVMRSLGRSPSEIDESMLIDEKGNTLETVNFQKFEEIMTPIMKPSGRDLVEFQQAFHQLDRDGNGLLSLYDIKSALKEVYGEDMPIDDIHALIETFDHDGDGQINMHEFLQMMQ